MPLPVGASSRVDSPCTRAAQPSRWASVGAGNDRSNQARVGARKAASGDRPPAPAGFAPGPRLGLLTRKF